ncbi:ABC transporter permease [Tengunoibacter tsumagoiensis]|uniref:Peptide ABC transporter permease n=1 Tax=Tengunoibacter tsumagoiensis TaxID=2014871 RepID=A0A402AAG3_9CHLR|nr:ABC transporter permease [Tengunoibacter tsumagoiensis]GCE16088.1 peptide ABC transporter permease [Tengunoibacter tsumagoiensis]
MIKFLLKRLIGLVFVVISVTFITFFIGYKAPDDPITQLLGQHYTIESYNQLKHAYGLDLPWYQQYWNFLVGLFHFDFGYSFQYKGRPVWDILKDGLPISLELGMWALLLQLLFGVTLGVLSALKANTWIDTTNMAVMLAIYALPSFILAITIQVGIVLLDQAFPDLNWPVANWGTPWHYTWSDLQFKIVPILVYALAGTAYYARLTRTSMMEVLKQDYIRTARSKGLAESIVTYRHGLRNALIPLVTVLGVSFGLLVTGAFFIEHVFNIPGIAETTLNSVNARDYPVIQATTVVLAIGVVLGNLLSDILYTLVDPRIKIE